MRGELKPQPQPGPGFNGYPVFALRGIDLGADPVETRIERHLEGPAGRYRRTVHLDGCRGGSQEPRRSDGE